MAEALRPALMITGFVFAMMVVVEYLNVLTRGVWQHTLTVHPWGRYAIAALLGAVPGCLGAFTVVAMYSHGVLTLGAVVAAMIATSGDEAFVMLALFPAQAVVLTLALLILGALVGVLVDLLGRRWRAQPLQACDGFLVHDEEHCRCFPKGQIVQQWRECSAPRGILAFGLALLVVALLGGEVGPPEWNWIRITVLAVAGFSLFIVATVPDHFLDEHLWNHVARQHVPRIFLWAWGALLVTQALESRLDLEGLIESSQWVVLLLACLVGLIPESGPHLILVTLYAQGMIPVSILLANSIVQDGHGMLPMLAYSRRGFLSVKLINLAVGVLCGAVVLALGW